MKKYRGSSIIEYALPITLIGLVVGLSLYYMQNSGNLSLFFANSIDSNYSATNKTLDVNKNSDEISLLVNPAPGSLNGSSAQPVEKCDDLKCNIDFGDFILTGVPSNFEEFVSSSGNSGGISQLCKMLLQISDQLKDKGNISGSKDYRDLANLGYFMADFQKVMEDSANSCISSGYTGANAYNCINQKLNTYNFTVPENLSSLIPGFKDQNFDDLIRGGYLSIPIAMQQYKAGSYDPSTQGSLPAYQIVSLIDKINKDSTYSESMKGVTVELYKGLVGLSEDSFCKYWAVRNYALTGNPSLTFKERDFISGDITGSFSYSVDQSLIKQMVNPISKVSDLDSTLICTTGLNDSNGQACK